MAGDLGTLTGSEAVARAKALVPVLAERAVKTEALRRLPDETFADLVASGLMRITQPRRFGGAELKRRERHGPTKFTSKSAIVINKLA